MPFVIALPTADRRRTHAFYSEALLLQPTGDELADDGLPEPLQFALEPGVNLMFIPTGGFGWVSADHEVAAAGHSECVLSVVAADPVDVDDMTERARRAGAVIKQEPHDPGWGYQSTFADPDGHLWMIIVAPTAAPAP